MATYKEIYGSTIEVVTSDPENPVQGQVWYNSTDNVVKGAAVTTAGAWATGNDMNTGRDELQGAGASSSSALASGGGQPDTAATEEFTKPSFTVKTITSS